MKLPLLLIVTPTLFFVALPSVAQAQEICTEIGGVMPLGGASLTGIASCKWNKGILTVKFLDGQSDVQEKIKKYAVEWTKHANIKFEFVTSGDADIRISFNKPGSWSYVGSCIPSTIGQNDATMNYGWLTPSIQDSEYSRVVLHEFGHALGFVHEHQSPSSNIPWNKDAVEKYYKQFGWTIAEIKENIFNRYSRNQTNGTVYDKSSIMHYSIPTSLTIGNFSTPWNANLSSLDIEFANYFYPHRFTKDRNNGTVSCNTYCGAVNGHKVVWGNEPGYCVKARREDNGSAVNCDSSAGPLSGSKQLTCFCDSGIIVRHGNNGTVTCEEFCKRTNEKCVAGWNTVTNANRHATCDHLAGDLKGPEVTCTCR